ncbi:MAG: methylenetetrahydrofolate reductase [NAD(P)H] [Candidatus Sumerlaeaceae bacterium]|nr:methylenetetrahydrofolate reductase [NAD(P)H] [Candidatus Sumerlaeaceae bacterium]
MQLKEIYATHNPAISIEFFPPKTPQGDENLAARIAVIRKLQPAFCSVTYGAGGSTRDKTLWWARRLKEEFGFEVMCHLTCVGHSRAEVEEVLRNLKAMGVENIIALRGDPPAGVAEWRPHPDGFHHASELVAAARQIGGFSIAVAGFPELHPEAESRESDLLHLREKVDAGADAIITQLFLDNQDYFRFVDSARATGITVPIVPGILPFRTVAQLRKFTTVYSRTKTGPAHIPERLEARLAQVENDDAAAYQLGIEYATEQCRELLDRGAPGIHFFCLNESHAVETILRNLSLKP